MTEDQRAILDQHGVINPTDLPVGARLVWANSPSEEAVIAATKAEAVTSPPFNLSSDVGNFDLDGEKLRNTKLSPATRLGMKERFDQIGAERKRRSTGEPPRISDEAYLAELASLLHAGVLNDYAALVANRILQATGHS